ncbi:hypothetical protein PVAP13_3NG249605 [Panicum virgatum]|uniref:Uncharacterized protein n=1 Tax=Panicum virgatum TaxID=38727 RepID=A0A8T0U140_PANVG|nr:hypothetical protein PVAP13_3NG249605 [Panicum virgatum]
MILKNIKIKKAALPCPVLLALEAASSSGGWSLEGRSATAGDRKPHDMGEAGFTASTAAASESRERSREEARNSNVTSRPAGDRHATHQRTCRDLDTMCDCLAFQQTFQFMRRYLETPRSVIL